LWQQVMLRRYLRWNAVVSGELPWQLLLEERE
jgi:hypothetical protein